MNESKNGDIDGTMKNQEEKERSRMHESKNKLMNKRRQEMKKDKEDD